MPVTVELEGSGPLWPNGPQVSDLFAYHPPHHDQAERYEKIRTAIREVAEVVMAACPSSATRTLALRDLHNAMMHANASIAINEHYESGPGIARLTSW